MRKTNAVIILGSVLALSGCPYQPSRFEVHKPSAIKDTGPSNSSCKADKLQYLVGEYRSVIDTLTFEMPIRVEEHGKAYTLEYLEKRARIILNEQMFIKQIVCG